jgi:uncharacterized Zn-binding protein involved in type VI secretion
VHMKSIGSMLNRGGSGVCAQPGSSIARRPLARAGDVWDNRYTTRKRVRLCQKAGKVRAG